MAIKSHGGSRPGAGRKSIYNEPTKSLRVPESQVDTVLRFLEDYRDKKKASHLKVVANEAVASIMSPVAFETAAYTIPMMSHSIAAGFPSPAEDYIEQGIDLNEHLILHREATYILRVSGWSMVEAGIHDGDEIIVDRAITPQHNHIVVAVVDNQLTVKRLSKTGKEVWLIAENPEFPDLLIKRDQELVIWGVVTHVLHKVGVFSKNYLKQTR